MEEDVNQNEINKSKIYNAWNETKECPSCGYRDYLWAETLATEAVELARNIESKTLEKAIRLTEEKIKAEENNMFFSHTDALFGLKQQLLNLKSDII